MTQIAGRNAWTLVPLPPASLRVEVPFVVAHELGHSFGLGDEYQDFDERHPQLLDSDTDPFSNLQFETAVRNGRTGPIETASIKWNWPRIRKAAVVTAAITAEAGGTRFRVPVAGVDGFLFEAGDIVLLRLRKPREPVGMKPVVALGFTREAEVVGPLAGGSVLLKAANGSALAFADLAPFVPGSILFAPTPARPSVKSPSYPYAEMIAKNVRDYMEANDRPLTSVPCAFNREAVVAPILPSSVALRSGFCRLFTPEIVACTRVGCATRAASSTRAVLRDGAEGAGGVQELLSGLPLHLGGLHRSAVPRRDRRRLRGHLPPAMIGRER